MVVWQSCFWCHKAEMKELGRDTHREVGGAKQKWNERMDRGKSKAPTKHSVNAVCWWWCLSIVQKVWKIAWASLCYPALFKQMKTHLISHRGNKAPIIISVVGFDVPGWQHCGPVLAARVLRYRYTTYNVGIAQKNNLFNTLPKLPT